jgi:hypothetical protein
MDHGTMVSKQPTDFAALSSPGFGLLLFPNIPLFQHSNIPVCLLLSAV